METLVGFTVQAWSKGVFRLSPREAPKKCLERILKYKPQTVEPTLGSYGYPVALSFGVVSSGLQNHRPYTLRRERERQLRHI